MIRVHHLNNSRSQRVLWLLEELGVPYEITRYQRNKATMLAPDEMKARASARQIAGHRG
jgi:glutathione S-transferase